MNIEFWCSVEIQSSNTLGTYNKSNTQDLEKYIQTLKISVITQKLLEMSNTKLAQIKEAKETFQALMELSRLLGTGLDVETLSICVRLCEAGVNPEVLATVVRELRKEVENSTDEVPSSSTQLK
ncbi:hypothetical protein HHI36_012082 [Cryptolaemus montrouzieri]|uniref:Mitotic-spindle organizing protein 1 n=1 Tax=Cryptolaemus montrouzieri TaxID=559131 RepID=A0ABD2NDF7_9CUCU